MASIVTARLEPSGLPAGSGYTTGFGVMAAVLVVAALAGLLIPSQRRRDGAAPEGAAGEAAAGLFPEIRLTKRSRSMPPTCAGPGYAGTGRADRRPAR